MIFWRHLNLVGLALPGMGPDLYHRAARLACKQNQLARFRGDSVNNITVADRHPLHLRVRQNHQLTDL